VIRSKCENIYTAFHHNVSFRQQNDDADDERAGRRRDENAKDNVINTQPTCSTYNLADLVGVVVVTSL
jgi:hypothetical protein